MTTENSCIRLCLPPTPSFHSVLESIDDDDDFISQKSLPISAISSRLNSSSTVSRNKTSIISSIFFLLHSDIDKYQLLQFLLPHRSRGLLLSKYQLVKCLYRYTNTESIKSGIIRSAIDSIEIGKNTESPTLKYMNDIQSILKLQWEEWTLLQNTYFQRLLEVHHKYNGQITLHNLSSLFDKLFVQTMQPQKLDNLYPIVEAIFDMIYVINASNSSVNSNKTNESMHLVFSCILNRTIITETCVFNALCMKPKGLASAIWKSRSDLWDVVYGVEYLKNHDVHIWKKLIDSSNNKLKRNDKSNSTKILIVVEILLGVPFSIMRCTRNNGNFESVVDKVSIFKNNIRQETEGFCVEEKLDGERSCVHIYRNENGKIMTKFYSRNRIIQPWYGSFVGDNNGIITRYLKEEYFDGIDSIILDGEMVTMSESTGMILGFQDVKRCSEKLYRQLNSIDTDNENIGLYNCLLCFDVLYYNGETLQVTPLIKRKEILARALSKMEEDSFKFIKLHKWNIGYNAEDIKVAMENIIKKHSEGLVVKHWDSKYLVGETSNKWIKIKPFYLEEFVNDLDVTIIGKLGSNYLCALYGGDGNESIKHTGDMTDSYRHWFVSFCLIRFGFHTEITNAINEKTSGSWIPYKKFESDIDLHEHRVKFGSLKPDYWIYPHNSIVITIKARNFVNARADIPNRFVLKSTLRHPYCTEVRHDKEYNECDTINCYYEKLHEKKRNHISGEFDDNKKNKRKMKTKKQLQLSNVNKNFIKTFAKKDTLFENFTFCVKTDCYNDGVLVETSEINGIIESHGGKVTTNPLQYHHGDRIIILADKYTLSVSELKKNYNIFKFKWCEDCIRTGQLVKPDPSHCLSVDDDFLSECQENINQFDLNNTVEYDYKTLWNVADKYLEKYPNDKYTLVSNQEEMIKLGMKFYNKIFMLLGFENSTNVRREVLEIEIELRGGILVDNQYDSNNIDYIVIDVEQFIDLSNYHNAKVLNETELMNLCND